MTRSLPVLLVATLACACATEPPDTTLDAGGRDAASLDATVVDPTAREDAAPPSDAARDVDAAPEACACVGLPAGWRCVRAINHCDRTVWLEAEGNETPAGVLDGRRELAPGGCYAYSLETLSAGRLWGDTGCEDGSCDTAPGTTPVTLAELTLGDTDFYDLSLVDGYNLPMALLPVEGTFTSSGGGDFDCGAPTCVADLNATCPDELAIASGGATVACRSACAALDTDQYCCRGAYGTPDTCPPTDYSMLFKAACPDAYSYAYDDLASTYTCHGPAHYDVLFCP